MERYPRGKEATKPEMIMRAAAKPARESEYPLAHNIWEKISNYRHWHGLYVSDLLELSLQSTDVSHCSSKEEEDYKEGLVLYQLHYRPKEWSSFS